MKKVKLNKKDIRKLELKRTLDLVIPLTENIQ